MTKKKYVIAIIAGTLAVGIFGIWSMRYGIMLEFFPEIYSGLVINNTFNEVSEKIGDSIEDVLGFDLDENEYTIGIRAKGEAFSEKEKTDADIRIGINEDDEYLAVEGSLLNMGKKESVSAYWDNERIAVKRGGNTAYMKTDVNNIPIKKVLFEDGGTKEFEKDIKIRTFEMINKGEINIQNNAKLLIGDKEREVQKWSIAFKGDDVKSYILDIIDRARFENSEDNKLSALFNLWMENKGYDKEDVQLTVKNAKRIIESYTVQDGKLTIYAYKGRVVKAEYSYDEGKSLVISLLGENIWEDISFSVVRVKNNDDKINVNISLRGDFDRKKEFGFEADVEIEEWKEGQFNRTVPVTLNVSFDADREKFRMDMSLYEDFYSISGKCANGKMFKVRVDSVRWCGNVWDKRGDMLIELHIDDSCLVKKPEIAGGDEVMNVEELIKALKGETAG